MARRARRLLARIGPLGQLTVASLIAFTVVAVVAAVVINRFAEQEAMQNARDQTRLAGHGIIEPLLTRAALDGRGADFERLDQAARAGVIGNGAARVRVWNADGQIVYSNDERLIGMRFPLGEGEVRALRDGTTKAAISDLTRPENLVERAIGPQLEVYLPLRARDGSGVLFEAYYPYQAIADRRREIWERFAPGLLAAVLLLFLVQFPLAWSLTRQLERRRQEREDLLLRAVTASTRERRRIARDIHDGAVQELVGVSLALTAAAAEQPSGSTAATTLASGAEATRHAIRSLRSLVIELHPPNLERDGLRAALDDLMDPLAQRGLSVSLAAAAADSLDLSTQAVVYRSAQEALRNVARHAGATSVSVTVARTATSAVLTVDDDGAGFTEVMAADRRREGHVGLSLLEELIGENGGKLSIMPREPRGTRLKVELPVP